MLSTDIPRMPGQYGAGSTQWGLCGNPIRAQVPPKAASPARPAHRPHEVVHGAGRHTLDVSLLDDRGQRLLRRAPRLEEAGKVTPLAQLRDRHVNPPCPGLPGALAIAVPL